MTTIFVIIFVAFVIVKPLVMRVLANSSPSESGSNFSVKRSGVNKATAPSDWNVVANTLGLGISTRGRSHYMTGTIDGFRVSVEDRVGGAKVEVDYESTLREFDIRPTRTQGRRFTNTEPILTGNADFDAVFESQSHRPDELRNFLTPVRQVALLALHSAVRIDEVDEDEIEVRLPSPCSPSDTIEAIKLVVYVAGVLSSTATTPPQTAEPIRHNVQDTFVSAPQDTIR